MEKSREVLGKLGSRIRWVVEGFCYKVWVLVRGLGKGYVVGGCWCWSIQEVVSRLFWR